MNFVVLAVVVASLGVGDGLVNPYQEAPVVSLRAGQVQGTTAPTFSRTVLAYRGIPYAKPPVGKRRLKVRRKRIAVKSEKKNKRHRRKRQPVTAKREKSQTPKFVTANLTYVMLDLPMIWWFRICACGVGACGF